jgi:hypothetical protein
MNLEVVYLNKTNFVNIISRYNRKGTLSTIPKTGGCSVKGPKIPRQVR